MQYSLEQLVDVELLQGLIESLHEATGFPLGVLNAEGEVIASVGWQDICAKFHRAHEISRIRCAKSDAANRHRLFQDGHALYQCANGLYDAAIPIALNGEYLGIVCLGQFLFDDEEVDRDRFRSQAEEFGFDQKAYLAALDKVPRFSRAQFDKDVRGCCRHIQILARLCLDNYRLKQENRRREAVEKKLQESERHYRMLADHVEDVIFIYGLDGTYKYISPSIIKLLGYTQEEFLNLSLEDHFTPEALAEVRLAIADNMARLSRGAIDRDAMRNELEQVRKDGTRIWTESMTLPLFDDSGNCTSWLGVVRDIAGRKSMERQLLWSEARYGALLKAIPDMLFLFDGGGRFLNWYAPSGSPLPMPKSRFLGKPLDEVLPLPLAQVTEAMFERAKETGEQQIYECCLDLESGRKCLEGRVVAAGPDEYLTIIRDKTRELEQRIELDETRARQQEYGRKLLKESILNRTMAEVAKSLTSPNAPLGAIAKLVLSMAREITGSAHGYVSAINAETGEDVGQTVTAMMDETLCNVPGDHVGFVKTLNGYEGLYGHALNTGEPFFTNDPAGHPASKGLPEGHLPVERFLSAPAVFEGRVVGQIAVANADNDYTREDLKLVSNLADLLALAIACKHHEQDILRQKELAELANCAKNDFLALMSHELRTPLNGMFGMLQLMESTELTEEQAEFVRVARKSGSGLLSIIQDILDFAKAEAGRLKVLEELFSVKEIMNDARNNFIASCQDRDIILDVKVDPEVPEMSFGGKRRIRQVLFNLLGNAVKFTPQGEVSVEAFLVNNAKGPRILFSVNDTGVGIPASRIREIFDPFTQVEGTFTRRYGGIGLGLGIVKRLVQLLDGHLCIDSVEGGGTRVHFCVPVRSAEEGLVAAMPEEVSEPVQGGRILVVEDDAINRRSLLRIVHKLGHRAEAAANGQEALDMLRQGEFDCVLMDVQMPVMDGVEATRHMREDLSMRHVPIIALTAYAMAGDRERFLAAGMDDYLAKPVDMATLRRAIDRALVGKA